jgi:hypothetical protein
LLTGLSEEKKQKITDELRAEYDFKSMLNGIRGKYAALFPSQPTTDNRPAKPKVSTRKSHP